MAVTFSSATSDISRLNGKCLFETHDEYELNSDITYRKRSSQFIIMLRCTDWGFSLTQ